jgi:hypothetical protein
MRISLRAARRLVVTGWFALVGLLLVAAQGQAAAPPEKILPDSTIALVKVQNAAALRRALAQSQLGQLWNDPALKAWKDAINERVEAAGANLKEDIGISFGELLELFQGSTAFALLKSEDPWMLFTPLVIADAGQSAAAMNNLLTRLTRKAELNGARVSTETFQGVTIHVIQLQKDDHPARGKDPDEDPDEDEDKDKHKAGENGRDDYPPIVWASQGGVFSISTDRDVLKDVIAHQEGRDNALAATRSYEEAVKKLGSDTPVFWFVDLPKVFRPLLQFGATARAGTDLNEIKELEALAQSIGLSALRAVTGSVAFNSGNFDSVARTMILVDGPAQGLLRVFRLPRVALQPEPWVPATVAYYQSLSWDLDHAFTALNALADTFAPGIVDLLQRQLVDPETGEPLNFKQDIFDPLGDRITIISDFKKPVTEQSQRMRLVVRLQDLVERLGGTWNEGRDERMLLAVALEDSKTFQNTLNKLIALSGLQPRKREFQGTIIHDFDVPEVALRYREGSRSAGRENPGKVQLMGPVSVAIARETLFISREPTLLEQVLRGGGPSLGDTEAYRTFSREVPDRVSSLSYVRPDLKARLTYDMVKSGQFEAALPLPGTAVAVGPDFSWLTELVEKGKAPEFSVFARYLAQGGRFSESSEDGLTITSFSLRKARP